MIDRRAQLARNLADVEQQIREACDAAGRDPGEVTLIAVSKTWPISDITVVNEFGVTDFGENRAEELLAKAGALADRGIRWHFLGQIQSKKAASIGRTAQAVHSIDRAKVIPGLAAGASAAGARLDAFIQVSLADMAPDSEAAGRGGATPAQIPGLADAIDSEPGLRLAGVMVLPPRSVDPGAAFARIAAISADLRHAYPSATAISAGMSHDFAAAIRAGATHVRVGSAVFGERGPVR